MPLPSPLQSWAIAVLGTRPLKLGGLVLRPGWPHLSAAQVGKGRARSIGPSALKGSLFRWAPQQSEGGSDTHHRGTLGGSFWAPPTSAPCRRYPQDSLGPWFHKLCQHVCGEGQGRGASVGTPVNHSWGPFPPSHLLNQLVGPREKTLVKNCVISVYCMILRHQFGDT